MDDSIYYKDFVSRGIGRGPSAFVKLFTDGRLPYVARIILRMRHCGSRTAPQARATHRLRLRPLLRTTAQSDPPEGEQRGSLHALRGQRAPSPGLWARTEHHERSICMESETGTHVFDWQCLRNCFAEGNGPRVGSVGVE